MTHPPRVYLATQSSWRRGAYPAVARRLEAAGNIIVSTWPARMDADLAPSGACLASALRMNLAEIEQADALVFIFGPECREAYAEVGYGYLLRKRMLFITYAAQPLPLCAEVTIHEGRGAVAVDWGTVPGALAELLSRICA